MKKFTDSEQYREALVLFDKQSSIRMRLIQIDCLARLSMFDDNEKSYAPHPIM